MLLVSCSIYLRAYWHRDRHFLERSTWLFWRLLRTIHGDVALLQFLLEFYLSLRMFASLSQQQRLFPPLFRCILWQVSSMDSSGMGILAMNVDTLDRWSRLGP